MTEHTQGPWAASKWPSGGSIVRQDREGRAHLICHVASSDQNDVGNAALIAAAPDLLAALKQIMAIHPVYGDVADIAEPAIAKAKGEQE